MTLYKTLATAEKNGYEITAYEVYEKFARTPRYEIVTSQNGMGLYVDKAARTTWKRKFNSMVNE